MLWDTDPTLVVALDTAKTFAKHTEYLMMFWPSDSMSRPRLGDVYKGLVQTFLRYRLLLGQRREWSGLRMQLVQACLKAGIAPPSTSIPRPMPRMNMKS